MVIVLVAKLSNQVIVEIIKNRLAELAAEKASVPSIYPDLGAVDIKPAQPNVLEMIGFIGTNTTKSVSTMVPLKPEVVTPNQGASTFLASVVHLPMQPADVITIQYEVDGVTQSEIFARDQSQPSAPVLGSDDLIRL